jgi:hypothetical protein
MVAMTAKSLPGRWRLAATVETFCAAPIAAAFRHSSSAADDFAATACEQPSGASGRIASTSPLCRVHHREVHPGQQREGQLDLENLVVLTGGEAARRVEGETSLLVKFPRAQWNQRSRLGSDETDHPPA